MSLKGAKVGRTGEGSFRVLISVRLAVVDVAEGMWGIGFIDFQGLWEGRKTALSFSVLSINRHFLGPVAKLRSYAVSRNCSNSMLLAFCMRRAASVSLRTPAMRF